MEDYEHKNNLPNLWFNDPQSKIENMEGFEPKFNFPSNWIDDPPIKCYKNMDTWDAFAYSEELFCFIDPPTDQTQLKDDDLANIETGDISSATKEPCDIDDKETPTEETTHEGQASRRVTEEELSQTCSRCHLRGHTCVTCDIPISHMMGRGGKQRKILHCGVCGEVGHNRRSCFHAV